MGLLYFFYPTGDVGVYDPLNGAWEQIKDPTSRAHFGVAVLDDVLYVIGGLALLGTKGQRDVLAVNEQYVPVGYDSQGYLDIQPSVTASSTTLSASDVTSSPVPSEHTPFWSFLTRSVVVVATVLTIGIIATGLVLQL